MKKEYEAIAALPDYPVKGQTTYARIEAHGRTVWKTKRTAQKHAREYKAKHMRDSWVQEL